MIKRLIALVTTILMLALVGCSSTTDTADTNTTETKTEATAAVKVADWIILSESYLGKTPDSFAYQRTIYDPETRVMYMVVTYTCYKGGGVSITPLYNADGSLRTYEGGAE